MTRAKQPTVALVSMPFHGCMSPSLGLGLLKAILERAGLAATLHNFNLDFLKFVVPDPFTATEAEIEFEQVPRPAAGEWIFRPEGSPEEERRSALALARTLDQGQEIAIPIEMRRKVGPFVEECAAKLLAGGHDILCFSVSYQQTRASLRVAEAVRRRAPGTRFVFGGASANGVKGQALIRAFPVIDVVCHGEAELLIEPLIRALRGEPGHALERLRGISFRSSAGLSLGQDDGPLVSLDELPPPDHHEWVEKVTAMQEARQLNPGVRLSLTYETARGCWWASKHQCSFCSIPRPAFRAKRPASVVRELDTLAERHGLRAIYCVDDILAPEYFDTVLPALAERSFGLILSAKPNLTRQQVELLARAGVRGVVLGIESLLTPTLGLMNKGGTAIRNIQALKWCAEFGIIPEWRYLSQVPGERLEWLQGLARLLPRLIHLTAPLASRIVIMRDSPYHADPERYGIEILGPDVQERLAFADLAPELREQLCHHFEFSFAGRDPAVDQFFAATIWPLLEAWRARFARHGCSLSVVHGPTESLLIEGPFWTPDRVLRVCGAPRSILLACEGIRSERSLAAGLEAVVGETVPAPLYEQLLALPQKAEPQVLSGSGSLEDTLAEVDAAALVVREEDQVLALPVNRTRFVQTPACRRRIALLRLRDLVRSGPGAGAIH